MSSIEFSFPFEGDLLIEKNDSVSFQTPLYKQKTKDTVSVELASLLHTKPDKIFQSLKKFVGDTIAKGDLIAEASGFMSKKQYNSEYDGLLKEVNHQTGTITLEVQTENEGTVNAFFTGEVEKIDVATDESGLKKATLTLKVKHFKEFHLKETSAFFGGEVVYCKNPIRAHLTADEVAHKVVVDERIPAYEQIKYEALGAKGFVTLHSLPEPTYMLFAKLQNESDFEKINEYKLPHCLILKDTNKLFFYE